MIGQTLNQILPLNTWLDLSSEPTNSSDGMRGYLTRLKDELLWPRILVRYAPPPGEIQPIAPDRL